MSAKIFSIANQKGGVGKTTTAINLACGLAKQKIPTLLVDLDPQGNATSGLGFERETGKSLYSAFHGEDRATSKVIRTDDKFLSLIPSETDLAAIETELASRENYLTVLKNTIQPLKESGNFKAIVFDCPPALGMLSMNSLCAADYLIIALQCEYLALEGLSQILEVQQQLKSAGVNDNLELGGILMTMYDVRTRLSNQVVNEVKSHLPEKLFSTLIPRSIRLSEAPSFGKSIYQYDPTSSGAVAYQNFSKEVVERFGLK